MKKNLFNSLLIAASIIVAAGFTSCSKDNDDFIGGDDSEITGGGGSTADSSYKYFDPFLQWGSSKEEATAFMQAIPGWKLENDSFGITTFLLKNPMTSVNYVFSEEHGLHSVTVFYYSPKEVSKLQKTVEEKYSCSLVEAAGSSSAFKMLMADNVMVNGKRCTVSLSVTNSMMSVTFAA